MRSRFYRRWRVAFWVGMGICVALGVVWVASIGWCFGMVVDRQSWLVQIEYGRVTFIAFGAPITGPRVFCGPLDWSEYMQYWRPHFVSNWAFRIVEIPLWMFVMFAAGLTAFARWRTKQQARAGCCVACGYSLGGIPRGSPCPECGKSIPATE